MKIIVRVRVSGKGQDRVHEMLVDIDPTLSWEVSHETRMEVQEFLDHFDIDFIPLEETLKRAIKMCGRFLVARHIHEVTGCSWMESRNLLDSLDL